MCYNYNVLAWSNDDAFPGPLQLTPSRLKEAANDKVSLFVDISCTKLTI